MNFFEHQDRARRNTKLLVVLFLAACLCIVVAVDLVIATLAASAGTFPGAWILPGTQWFRQNMPLLVWTSLGTIAFIALASLYKTASLKGGGGRVAQGLGGTLVSRDARDPGHRRLVNVVEEMAIASGVPVPEVYLLEKEEGINAFAAGFTPGDAAIGVTRGCVDRLNREELQGVIAHEFSHILRGDMRLNMRLMGILFGILLIGVVGEGVLRSTFRGQRASRVSSSRRGGSGGLVVVAVGAALMAIGYIGVFFGRLIKAGVSRQREFLADASAVQFTREPQGIAGALKKIGGFAEGSRIHTHRAEEVSHMLFGARKPSFTSLLATHPPLVERIQAIDPTFRPAEFGRVAAEAAAIEAAALEEGVDAEAVRSMVSGLAGPVPSTAIGLTPDAVVEGLGNPAPEHIQYASTLLAAIPNSVRAAMGSPDGAAALLFALLLAGDDETRTRQLALIDKELGGAYGPPAARLYGDLRDLGPEFRLPLLDLAFPALKRSDLATSDRFLKVLDGLIRADGKVDPFEFVLSKLVRSHLLDAARPHRPRGGISLGARMEEVKTLLSVVAQLGQKDPVRARIAYDQGMHRMFGSHWPPYAPAESWVKAIEHALTRLDGLAIPAKRQLVEALAATVSQDGKVTVVEAELLRAVCETLHCPLPPLGAGIPSPV
jgi:Zn-dependent protease with chaperone function